ncbi:MAG: Holliday junction branch migration DNA helicase RuvB [Deltaproteobacteria bacterium]|nr:Holliday junction branch migration DNA helicase RuvB [Deltaproteobacteria bacterium]
MDAVPERVMAAGALPGEERQDVTLRPHSFEELIGQHELVANLKVFVTAARERHEALDHVLLCGPPGLGKTTIAHLIAHELGSEIHVTSGPALERKDLAGVLSHLGERDLLFIDEIHRLSPVVEEILYPAMEDFKIDLVLGGGPRARTLEMRLPRFTLVGATTRTGLLTGPMRDRFGYTARLRHYTTDELHQVVRRSASILETAADADGTEEIAKRSRGTPRIANRLLRRVRDFAEVEGEGKITLKLAQHALSRLGVDERGFDEMDRRLLHTLVVKFGGGPVGVETLGAALAEEADTLEHVYEPYLIQEGFVQRTPRGRVATARAYELVGVPVPARLPGQGDLF